ncbi:hypothetical protein CC78DRAFT_536733 [Lojkania enalia]|uniref:Uncharacterized protein n=1 Tax=Lojkania enalia TaxID=147567 RepID=A0A9P4K0J7_9PLEO|nr:hypothetical protein CC78DRAFT_536733 [Didymosphaeria enalia]
MAYADDYTTLKYFILFTAVIAFYAYFTLLLYPPFIRKNYTSSYQPQFSNLAARSLGAWFLLSAVTRAGAWYFWAERGWYDACMVSLAVPLWHYGIEHLVFGSVTWGQILMAYGIDGGGLVWMMAVRKGVLRL